ncbi:sodium/calcium exchanger 3-like isoform X3 [Watersipora subatra]
MDNCIEVRTNYSNTQGEPLGYTVEILCGNHTEQCESWLLLPGENLWNDGVRGFLYLIAMLWTFIGIAKASDIFMMSIETITAKKRKISQWDAEREEVIEREVLIWNETVANLTLMALGSSAPEILIAFIEALTRLPTTMEQVEHLRDEGNLGVFTIMGSASYNLLIISAICIVAPDLPETKKVSQFSVFLLTSGWSLWAYVWMLLVVKVISPGEIQIWEALVTLAFFPLMAITAYCQDNHWWIHKCKGRVEAEEMSPDGESHPNIRVLNHNDHHGGLIHGRSKELALIETEHQQKHVRKSEQNLHDLEEGNGDDYEGDSQVDIIEFRNAPGKNSRPKTPKLSPLAADPTHLNAVGKTLSEEDLIGKFTFSAPSYSVLESAGCLEVDIIFHRKKPSQAKVKLANGTANNNTPNTPTSNGTVETALVEDTAVTGVVGVQWETREGSAKLNRDFKFSSGKLAPLTGKLVFNSDEYKKTISIPIVNDHEFEPDTDFYIILKNPEGDAGLGDPSVTRVTIIDDDEPGEFSFSKHQYYAEGGKCILTVQRSKGCDGTVTLQYKSIDGSAKGGDSLETADFIAVTDGLLEFKHSESSKTIGIECGDPNKQKNFIMTLSNPSAGAKIGPVPAAFINLHTTDDGLDDRLGDIMDEDDTPVSWASQFVDALTPSPDEDSEDGKISWFDYIMHFISLPWKLFCAIIPPVRYAGGSISFICSIIWLGIMSLIVEQLASLLGCVIGLRTAASGVSIVALGTSVPDTFASRTAALQDEYADAAIGNITGSNSVNVFLGLGLPWVLLTIYYQARFGIHYPIMSDNLTQAVILFVSVGSLCLLILLIRRFTVGGELGGKKVTAYVTAGFLSLVWACFIAIVILIVYKIIPWDMA